MKKLMLAIFLAPSLIAMSYGQDLTDDPNYKARCVVCHGAGAEGKANMKIPALKSVAGKKDAELIKAIEDGNSTSTPKMPPFKEKLTADDIKMLVAEIKALK
ncbi:MAG TPA: cytochrome c [Terriglobales bacterium]|jgi:cytochrome c553